MHSVPVMTFLGLTLRRPHLARACVASVVTAISLFALASACSTGGPGGPFTCQSPPSSGPNSAACASCGVANCPAQSAITGACGTMVSCIEACECSSSKCADKCASAASSECQTWVTAMVSCEKQSPACIASCAGEGGIYVTPRDAGSPRDTGVDVAHHDASTAPEASETLRVQPAERELGRRL